MFLGQTWLLWCLFKIWTRFKIVFVKNTFKRENRLSERHFLTKIFIFLKIVFSKDNFWLKFGQKVFFRKTIFTFKSVFYKDDFEWIHISNKHHNSHVWPKNLKKCILATLASGRERVVDMRRRTKMVHAAQVWLLSWPHPIH